jgi:hypothetical protein
VPSFQNETLALLREEFLRECRFLATVHRYFAYKPLYTLSVKMSDFTVDVIPDVKTE